MKTLLLLAAIIGLTIGTPIGNTCAYITDTGVKIYNQAICGTADTEKLLCVLGTCLGTLKNNMCGTSAVCSIGFYAHPTFKICAPCPANCGVCTDGSTCTDCYDYFFVNDAKTCTAGPSNCYDPVSATECKSTGCDPGFFLNTNTPPTCSAGPTNCNAPSSATVCTTCKSTFYWNTTTSACTSAGTNCLTADSDTVCTSCANNYWIDIWSTTGKTVCSGPVANCDYIRKPGYCTACKDGYYLSQDSLLSTTCKAITVSGCKASSTSTTVCTTCNSYYILWKECKAYLSNCKVAASATACGTCNDGYALDTSTKLCVFCGVGYKQCSSSAGTVSGQSGCLTGWYMSSTNSVCVRCGGSYISACSQKTHTTAFSKAVAKCASGYTKTSSGTCTSCFYLASSTGAIAAYASCTVDDNNALVSATCASNAYSSATNRCALCSTYALTCTASTDSTCMTGYGVKGTTCAACSTGVNGCTFTSNVEQPTTKCITDVDGVQNYYLYSSTNPTCFACPTAYAKTCGLKTAATVACATGYGFSSLGKGCIACSSVAGSGFSTCTFTTGDVISSFTCLDGYITYGSGATAACPSCSVASSVIVSGSSTATSGFIAHAATCAISAAGVITPATCASGYIISGTTICASCTAATTISSTDTTGFDTHATACSLSSTTITVTACADGYCLDTDSGAKTCLASAGVQGGKCVSATSGGTTTYSSITGCAADYAYRSGKTVLADACVSKTGCAASDTNAGCTFDGTNYVYYTCKSGYASSATNVACATCTSLGSSQSATNSARWNTCKYDATTSKYVVTSCSADGTDYYAPASIAGSTGCNKCTNANVVKAAECSASGYLVDDDNACAAGYVRSLDLTTCTQKAEYTVYPLLKDLTCSTGYVLNTNTNLCVACPPGSGVTPTECAFVASSSTFNSYKCGTGSILYSSGGYCVSCGSAATGCTLSGSTSTVATITGCQEGYAIKVTSAGVYSCEACTGTGVSTCEFYTISSCSGAYYLDSTNNACTSCSDSYAATCSSDGKTALTCKTGYSLYSSACKPCNTGSPYVSVDKCTFDSTGAVSGITSCYSGYYKGPTSTTDTTQTCLKCKTGSLTDDGKIITCTYNSASPSYPTITACDAGSYLGTTCIASPSNCGTPISPGTCSSSGCDTGYYYKDGSCITCGTGASGCTYSSTTSTATITGCLTGYFFDSTAKSCSQSAVGCTTWTNSTYCSAAASGYYLKDGSPNSCGTGATACSYSSNTVTISGCAETYYLSSASPATCEACPTGCKACSSTGTCSSCISGYFLVGTTCYAATDYCATANQVATCAGCTVNYYWNTTKSSCESCAISGCVHCSAYGVCSVCATGYYLSSGACVACPTTTLGSCVSCSSATTCDQCASGYYWDSTSKACKACATGCNFCAEAATCYECADNYYKNSSNLCSKCNTGCKVCSDSVNCTTCADGYVKVSSTCSACYSACKTCSGTAQNNCLTCPTNSTATSQTISGVTGNSCVCNSGYSWDSTQLKCLAGTGSASYVFVGLLSLLAILFALL